jgi:hypothetical protein
MTDKDALEILKQCALDGVCVFYPQHARKRMAERNITPLQILTCLEKGRITESPCRDARGDWRCTIEHYTAGSAINVAAAIKYNNKGVYTVIVTVF